MYPAVFDINTNDRSVNGFITHIHQICERVSTCLQWLSDEMDFDIDLHALYDLYLGGHLAKKGIEKSVSELIGSVPDDVVVDTYTGRVKKVELIVRMLQLIPKVFFDTVRIDGTCVYLPAESEAFIRQSLKHRGL